MSDRESMRDLEKGKQLANRYTLKNKLGAGRHTATWLASDRLTKTSVALKIALDPAYASALRKEWQTSIRLMHAHIVRVFEFHDDPDAAFYTLQWVDGPDIGVLTAAPVQHILPPIGLIADALRYAHGKSVVHRDIKASNILLDHNGAPYLIDFGVASVDADDIGGGSLIAASPQRLDGLPPAPSDDIFALGGLVYELVSGRSPYSSANTADDIRGLVPPPVAAADGTPLPTAINALVMRMLDKEASARPDAETVVAEFEAAGFKAAPAPKRYIDSKPAIDDVEVSDAIRPTARAATAAPSVADVAPAAGIRPRTLGIALAVLLAILIGVIFLLPKTVSVDEARPVAGEDAGAAPAAEVSRARGVEFSENVEDLRGRDERVQARSETEAVLGELLSTMDTLERRAVARWGGLQYKQAQAVYAAGDAAYLARDYATAADKYRQAIDIADPLLEEVDQVFATTFEAAQAALDAGESTEALPLFDLAVAISPNHAGAKAGYERAKNLDTVLTLTDQGFAQEKELELEAARQSFARAVEIDPEWKPASDGLERVLETIKQMEFDQRMTEGLAALADRDFLGAQAAFRMARQLKPDSPEPADGMLQVDQGIRLVRIESLERDARSQENSEQWDVAVETYQAILELDANLEFAQRGLSHARQMLALHQRLDDYIANPDSLSAPATMQAATKLIVDITRMPSIGPRLGDQRDELSRLLKRAATPLRVRFLSDNVTDVSIYKVGKLGSFATQELSLRPGTYVAVGSRPGYRDVRLEFRVAPEIELEPVVVRCEEPI